MFGSDEAKDQTLTGRDIKGELQMESSGGYAAPPPAPTQPGYYQQPTQPPPQYYAPPPTYYPPAPAPQYYPPAPPQQYGYSQPTPVPDYYSDPATGSPDVDYYDEAPAPAENYSQAPRSRQAYANTSQREFKATQLLPFGLNSFLADDYLGGGVSLALQGGSLVMWYLAYADENSTYESAAKTIEDASNNPDYSQEDIEEFQRVTDEYLAQKQTEQMIYLGVFGASYVGSIIYAYFTSKPKVKRRRRRSNSRYYGTLDYKPSEIVQITPEEDRFKFVSFSNDFESLSLGLSLNL